MTREDRQIKMLITEPTINIPLFTTRFPSVDRLFYVIIFIIGKGLTLSGTPPVQWFLYMVAVPQRVPQGVPQGVPLQGILLQPDVVAWTRMGKGDELWAVLLPCLHSRGERLLSTVSQVTIQRILSQEKCQLDAWHALQQWSVPGVCTLGPWR